MEPKAAFVSPSKGRKIKQSRNLSSGCFLLVVLVAQNRAGVDADGWESGSGRG